MLADPKNNNSVLEFSYGEYFQINVKKKCFVDLAYIIFQKNQNIFFVKEPQIFFDNKTECVRLELYIKLNKKSVLSEEIEYVLNNFSQKIKYLFSIIAITIIIFVENNENFELN